MPADQFQTFLKAVLPDMGYRWRRFDRRNIRRRIRSRMEALRIYELEKYAQLLIEDPAERDVLDSLLRLTITRFFRNSWLWEDLRVLITTYTGPEVGSSTLKIWSAGCAGGEEPYSLAMLLDDLCRSGRFKGTWAILGTDTDVPSLQRARGTLYKWGSVREIPPHLLKRWFKEENGNWILDDEVRKLVNFQEHNILTTEPPGLFNFVFLRNSVLTYNTEKVQRQVLKRIAGSLLQPGYLVIGRTEKVPEGEGFEERSKCIYRKKE